MSKTAYALIAIMVAAVLFMGAVRLREVRMRHQQAKEEASRNDGNLFTFQNVPVSLAAPQGEIQSAPVEYRPQGQEVFLEDVQLAPQQKRKQARDTISSILADFEKNTSLAGFNQEIDQASDGEIQGLEDLSTQNLMQIVQQHPQIKGVVEKHLKNPDFSKMIDEIFQNPQFQQSVQTLQEADSSQRP